MEWTEIKIYTSKEGVEILCSRLTDIGIKGFVIEDADDFKDLLKDKKIYYDYIDEALLSLSERETAVIAYVPENSQGHEMLKLIKSELVWLKAADEGSRYGRLEAELSKIREEDWSENWKQYFKPLKIGGKLVVKPSWEEYNNTGNEIVLELDPASSFGTGQHSTTKLCLEMLQDYIKPGCRMLDIGCGSGILSIGGVLLGADFVTAIDIDENAVRTTEENIKKNNIEKSRYVLFCGNITEDKGLSEKIGGGYDIITANIVADAIIIMKDLLYGYLKDGGILIASGIISKRNAEVMGALTDAGFNIAEIRDEDDWIAAAALKHSPQRGV